MLSFSLFSVIYMQDLHLEMFIINVYEDKTINLYYAFRARNYYAIHQQKYCLYCFLTISPNYSTPQAFGEKGDDEDCL